MDHKLTIQPSSYADRLNEMSRAAFENFGRYANFFDYARQTDLNLVEEHYGSRLYNSFNVYYILTGFGGNVDRVITLYGFHGPAVWKKITEDALGLCMWLDRVRPDPIATGLEILVNAAQDFWLDAINERNRLSLGLSHQYTDTEKQALHEAVNLEGNAWRAYRDLSEIAAGMLKRPYLY